jgi:isopenicillin N synthase-like dioxygenase
VSAARLHDVPDISLAACRGGGEAEVRALARRIDEACIRTGFLLISDHGLAQPLLDDAFGLTAGFFDQTQAEKDRWHPSLPGKQRGYHAFETRGLAATLGKQAPLDLRESLFIGPVADHLARFAHLPGGADAYAPNIYPERPERLADTLRALYAAFESLSETLLELMAVALGAPRDFFAGKIARHFSIMA